MRHKVKNFSKFAVPKLTINPIQTRFETMKKITILLAFLLYASISYSQSSNLVFFSEQGERFLVVLNGIQQNAAPETNVRITELPAPNYKVKIIFEDAKIPELDKNLFLEQGMEYTCNIKKNSKGEYVLRLLSQVALAQAPPPPPAQHVIIYSTTAPAVTNTTSTITTGTAVTTTTAGGVTAGISVGGATTTVTTTSTTSTSSATMTTGGNATGGQVVYVLPGYNGPYGCAYPMEPSDFAQAKSSISSKSFEDSKLTIAKQIAGANCLLCSQVKDIMTLFTYESTKLDFAKFAYQYTLDPGNYYLLNDAFTFESSIDELNQYINGR
jgi:hypothetical protein